MAISGVGASSYISTGVKGAGGLSNTAKLYLQGLQQKYPKMSVTVASFKNSREQEKYAWGCLGGFHNVAISSNILEQMANDPAVAAKYEKYFEEYDPEIAREASKRGGRELLAFGMVIDKDGKVSYWGICQTSPEELAREEKQKAKRKKKEEELEAKLEEMRLIKAKAMKELLEQIRNIGKGEEQGITKRLRKPASKIDLNV
jgi:Skp family chaperone for outer membrane proteins